MMVSIKELSDMTGRRVLITGGAGHLGRVMAETLAELGASIVLLDRSDSDLESTREFIHRNWCVDCSSISCDLESLDDRKSAIDHIKADGKGLNCLINNAAFAGSTLLDGWVEEFEMQSIDTWRRAIEVNLTASFHLSQGLASELRKSEGGNIINVASIYGEIGPDWRLYEGTDMGNPAAYAASKGGLVQLTRWMATTLAPDIRVNAFSPGGIYRNQPDKFVERFKNKTPLGRMAIEDDFRGVTAYLASSLSKYTTGQVISVDGGWTAW